MAEYGYVVGWLKVREVGCGWDGKQLRVVGWESRWDGICRHTTNWQLMGCTNRSDGDGMVACDGNEIPRPIPSHPITIPFVMVIPSHRITTHRPEKYAPITNKTQKNTSTSAIFKSKRHKKTARTHPNTQHTENSGRDEQRAVSSQQHSCTYHRAPQQGKKIIFFSMRDKGRFFLYCCCAVLPLYPSCDIAVWLHLSVRKIWCPSIFFEAV